MDFLAGSDPLRCRRIFPQLLYRTPRDSTPIACALYGRSDVCVGCMVLAEKPVLLWRGLFVVARKYSFSAGFRRRLVAGARVVGIAFGLFGDGIDAAGRIAATASAAKNSERRRRRFPLPQPSPRGEGVETG